MDIIRSIGKRDLYINDQLDQFIFNQHV